MSAPNGNGGSLARALAAIVGSGHVRTAPAERASGKLAGDTATAVAIRSAPARRVTGLGPNVVPPVVVPPVVVPPVVVVVEPPVVEPPPPPPPPPATGQLTLPVLTPVVIRPIELLPEAVNHMAPSEPATMPKSAELPLGRP